MIELLAGLDSQGSHEMESSAHERVEKKMDRTASLAQAGDPGGLRGGQARALSKHDTRATSRAGRGSLSGGDATGDEPTGAASNQASRDADFGEYQLSLGTAAGRVLLA